MFVEKVAQIDDILFGEINPCYVFFVNWIYYAYLQVVLVTSFRLVNDERVIPTVLDFVDFKAPHIAT
tara:strand:- start:35 stop:235 length:201 start_codon:yes stop_codon:yes gene_type:complete